MIGWLLCKLNGHLRGKRIATDPTGKTFQCPRCKATWKRTVKQEKAE